MREIRREASSPEIADLVAKYNLRRAGARPNLVQYTKDVWSRRHFIGTFSKATNAVGYSTSFLGQAWQLLTPLLNVAVYFLIFGVLLNTKHNVHNFFAYLVIGIFVFAYTQTAMMLGARSITDNINLTRVLHFPRAVLPISAVLIATQRLLYSLVILIPIVLITREPIALRWLLLIPALLLQTGFCLGVGFAIARIGARVPDTSQVLPFVMRTWLYMSGVVYQISAVTKNHAHWIKVILEVNPAAVYVQLVRDALLTRQESYPHIWPLAIGWAVVALVLGYVYFWRAEESYGRV